MTTALRTRAADVEFTSELILRFLLPHQRTEDAPGDTTSAAAQLRAIAHFVDRGEPITFSLPAFPCKSPNPRKVLGHLPDLGELLSLRFLHQLCEQVARVYEPGARMLICSDEAAANGLRAANRYPDSAGGAVVERLAERLAVDSARLVLGCGSVALCQQVVQAMCGPGDEVIFAAPAFDAYSLLTRIAGAVPRPVPLDTAHRHDVPATLAALTDATRVVFLTNPHNPTGTALRHRELSRLLSAVPDRVLVVLDEAYREFVTDPDVPDGLRLADDRDNVAVLRTFSKAYGLAGLRIGYGVAPPPLAAALRTVGLPFAVNSAAQAAAVATLEHEPADGRIGLITAERDRVTAELTVLGCPPPPSQANFVWLHLGARTASFARHCRERKVMVRPLPPHGVRVSIGSRSDNDAFLAAAGEFRFGAGDD